MRVAIYAWVSTPDGKGQSPQMQLRELLEHCERRAWALGTATTLLGIYVKHKFGL